MVGALITFNYRASPFSRTTSASPNDVQLGSAVFTLVRFGFGFVVFGS